MENFKTLAEALNHKEFRINFCKSNPAATSISTFVLHHLELSSHLNCNKCNKREADSKDSYEVEVNGKKLEAAHNLLWCLACDRVMHISCSGELSAQLVDLNAPWRCSHCKTDPTNKYAIDVVTSKKCNLPFNSRLEIIKPSFKDDDDDDEESYQDGISQSLHVDHNLNPITLEFRNKFEQQKKETLKLGDMLGEAAERNIQLSNDLDQARRESEANKTMVDQLLQELQKYKNANANPTQFNQPKSFQSQQSKHANPQPSTSQQQPKPASSSTQFNHQEYQRSSTFSEKVLTAEDILCNVNSSRSVPPSQSQQGHSSFFRTFVQHEDVHQLSVGERLAHENSYNFNLVEIRKNLPKIEKFDGNPNNWLIFQRSVERNRREGYYSNELTKYHIRNALTGLALQRVERLFEFSTADEIMSILKESFGNSMLVVEQARKKILSIKLPKNLTHANVIEATTIIASYLQACRYADVQFHDVSLSSHIHQQLEPLHQQSYYQYFMLHYPGQTRVERLDAQLEFLENLAKTLPLGTFNLSEEKDNKGKKNNNNYQLLSIATSSESSNYHKGNKSYASNDSKNDFKFEIRSKSTAPYIGYDMNKVKSISKKCLFCDRNGHYSVECRNYRAMAMDERHNQVKSKNICQNCLLTADHNHKECQVKLGCGFNIDTTSKCTLKHHISLHRGKSTSKSPYKKQQNRARGNQNRERAQNAINQQQQNNNNANITSESSQSVPNAENKYQGPAALNTMSLSSLEDNGYQLCSLNSSDAQGISNSSPRTIKLFRTFVFGDSAKALAYAVGDSAAEISLIKKSLIDALGIVGVPCYIDVQWTDRQIKSIPAHRVNIKIKGILSDSKDYIIQDCFAIDDFNLPPRSLDVVDLKKKFPYLEGIPFAGYKNAIPALLIGTKDAHLIEAIEPVKQDGANKPVGIKTKIGYSIYGGSSENPPFLHSTLTISNMQESFEETNTNNHDDELSKLYTYSCSLESLCIKPTNQKLTADELSAIDLVNSEMRILKNGTVELPLIWKRINGKIPSLPNNIQMVLKRQIAQENKLKRTPELLQSFNDNFKALIDAGYVRAATQRDLSYNWPNVSYIPMSLVVNSNKIPIKTRNVYDASARYQGTSLNDNLLMGPNLLIDILKPLMRMRINQIAFTADVRQMFHRIQICERDQQVQRILWREFLNQPMQVFIQQVMLFGPKCSPFCSQIVKNKTAEKFLDCYPEAAKSLLNFVYMDDLLTSEPTIEKAVAIAKQCIEILASINWELISFQSNSPQFLSALPQTHIKQDWIPLMTMEEEAYTTKVLGISWNPAQDMFVFDLNKNVFIKLVAECGHRPTKRDQCSTISRIFDAMGLIAHCTIRGRILLQRSWKQKLDWDDEISEDAHKEWLKWLMELQQVSTLRIPRKRFELNSLSEANSLEIHTFADAGKEAIAAVTYMVAVTNNYREVSFVMAKTKVAPIKLSTNMEISQMPRLELLACLIAARMTANVIKLHEDHTFKIFLWTDSEIVLKWILNDNLKLPKFALAPIEEILDITERKQWKYVDSLNNVADMATKFQKINFADITNDWYQGPKFLKHPSNQWPLQKFEVPQTQVLLLTQMHETIIIPRQLPPINCPLASRFMIDLLPPSITSNWSKLVRATCRALKIYFDALIPLLKSKAWRDDKIRREIKTKAALHSITPSDIERAQLFIIRIMQIESYPVEYELLRKGKRISNRELLQLNVFMDQDGLIRIHSRVNLPTSNYPQKFAPLVPRKSRITPVMLFHYHLKFKHICLEAQMAEFRAHFWMPALRQGLKQIVSICNHCHLMRTNPYVPKMADLPTYRVDPNLKPFEVTGLDCAGPYMVYNHTRQKKVWILIFTCTTTRFIHLHLLNSMDTMHTIEAIASVNAAHGPIAKLISDNGKNFKGASNIFHREKIELINQLRRTKHEIEARFAEQNLLKWQFIPVQSPWFGAFYERLIKEVKRAIADEVKDKKIQRVAFNIALQEAAHRINCRPLTHNSISHEDEEVLTPHHLAKYRSGWPLLPSANKFKKPHDPNEDRSYYSKGLKIAGGICQRFVKNYLTELTKRTKWYKDTPPLAVNDLVLLIDPTQTRKKWDRARIIKLYKSRDGKKRVADVLLADGTLKKNRSVQRLAKIEISTRA